jgi:hypothetical protein
MIGQMSIYDLMKKTCDTCVNFRPVYGYEDEDFRACFVDVISKSNDPDKEACDQYEESDK